MRIPEDQSEYVAWAQVVLGSNFGESTERLYNSNLAVALNEARAHPFFTGLDRFLENCSKDYEAEHGAPLLMNDKPLQLAQKPFRSVVNKSYRQNIVWNSQAPSEPPTGWVTAENLYEKMDDLVRGTLYCKYIDGPIYIAERLGRWAKELNLTSCHASQQRMEGYYAYHFNLELPMELNTLDMTAMPVNLSIELQLTTQLQEIMYTITHRFYNDRRDRRVSDQKAWQWEIKSDQFRAGYLAHTLHMLEATIVELRDSQG